VYTPDQDATIAMAVLDETGEIVCDADVNLEILLPDSTTEELTTKNKGISINDVCGKKEFTLDPDYEAHYTVNQIGTYKLKLTAKTKNGEYSIDDSFQVKETVDFDVERVSATRLYPVLTYPMYINITANQDFEGVVTDIVPEDFDVLPSGEGQEYRDVLKSSDRGHGTSEGQVLAAETNNLRKPYDGDHIITLGFGKQYGIEELIDKIFKKNNIEGHDGVDIDMPTGTPIFATDGGKVIKAGKGVYGNTIVIEHAWGQSYYGHLKDIEVVEGDTVDRGQEIGLSGSTGISTGPHLHFSIKPHDAQEDNGYHGMIDPQSLIAFEDVSEDNFKSAVLGATTSNLFPTKTITWEVHLKKGERVKLGYTYHTPITSPEFYRLGKLSIIEQDIKEEAQTKFKISCSKKK
jgi:murein DD-endopeptidase MepM/ murein hydrolase activator NlpD